MGRYSPGRSYNHGIRKDRADDYAIYWTVDYYYAGSRQRFPRQFRRWTDEKGARRFAKKWKVNFDFDRQTGRTTRILLRAADAARDGKRVIFVGHRHDFAEGYAVDQLLVHCPEAKRVRKNLVRVGQGEIEFMGVEKFNTHTRRKTDPRPGYYDHYMPRPASRTSFTGLRNC